MTNEAQAQAGGEAAPAAPTAAGEPPKLWQPSRKPAHRVDQAAAAADRGLVIERGAKGGVIAVLGRYLKRPFVRLVIGLGLFILGAIIYDATINFGRWTERPAKQKATPHKGLRPVPDTPDG